jgi:hypothetical protein
MLRRTSNCFPRWHSNAVRRGNPTYHKYKELSRWQREAQGLTKWDHRQSHRERPFANRFNPENVGLTKGTSSFAWKWWYTQYPFLPNVPPEGYRKPAPSGNIPSTWDDDIKDLVKLSDDSLRKFLMEKLTEVIFEETQRDGYELRRLDFEGKPLTDLPEKRIIENFVFEEDSFRERVVQQVVEGIFRLTPTSEDRKNLKSVSSVIDFVVAHVTAARPPRQTDVTDAVKNVLSSFPLQPRLGFEHALPTDTRDPIMIEWERMHRLDWQFGNAVFTPRSRETQRGNLVWMRLERDLARRQLATLGNN